MNRGQQIREHSRIFKSYLIRSTDEQNRILWPHLNVLDVRVIVAESGVVLQQRILEVARVCGKTGAAEKHGGA